MKSLILAACLMVATAVSSVTATEFCPTGQLSSNVNITLNDETGPTHSIASGCIVDPELDIEIDASMDVGTAASPATTVNIVGVNIGAQSTMVLIGCDNNDHAALRAPYVINILNNRFGNDAVLFVRGALPPMSAVTIQSNRFNASTPLGTRIPAPYTSVSTWASCIIFYDLTLNNAQIDVSLNNIYGSDIGGAARIFGVYAPTNIFFMGDNSKFNVHNNNITTICNPLVLNGICGYGVMTNNLFAYAKGEYNVDNNVFITAGSLVSNMPNIINPVSSGKVTFNGNRGTLNTMYLPYTISSSLQPFVMFNSINVQAQSSVEVIGNTFDITGTSGMFGFYGDFIFFENTSITISNNRLTSRSCTPGIYFNEHSTAGNSRVRILNNEFYRDDDTAVDTPMLFFGNSFGLKETSTLTVAYNTFGGRVVPASALLLDLAATAINNFNFDGNARLLMCGNVLGGKALLTASAVWSAIHTSLRSRVAINGCDGTPLPTNITAATTTVAAITTRSNATTAFPVPTTGNFTDAPLNNGSGAVNGCMVTMAAALIVLVVGTLFN
eukprot:GDKJ01042683.1.p1 GENE.GDKJ01042683.1~~GDKJ01042683.1.p1  ORF type:complete len:555 (+),score=104.70 GDKJ01042683.1:46-1710(+)